MITKILLEMRLKSTFAAFAVISLLLSGCYDDSKLTNRVDILETKVNELEALCKSMNTDMESLKTIMKNYENAVTVTSVDKTENGYTIVFSNGTTAEISNGTKGEKGDKGETGDKGDKGDSGNKGDKGDKGDSPVIGVINEEGILYWTVNGEYLLDDKGNKVSVAAPVTPQFKYVESEDTWYISIDGTEWKALSSKVDHCYLFKDVKETDNDVTFTLQDGSSIVIPKTKPFAFTLSKTEAIVAAGSTVEIPYSITGADNNTVIDCIATGEIKARIDQNKSVVSVTAPTEVTEGKVVVFATKGDRSIVRSLQFLGCTFTASETAFEASPNGETIKFNITTDLSKEGYKIVIPADCNWISNIITKATRVDAISFDVSENTSSKTRSAELSLQSSSGIEITKLTVKQASPMVQAEKSKFKILYLQNDTQCKDEKFLFDNEWMINKDDYYPYIGGDPAKKGAVGYKYFGIQASIPAREDANISFTIDAGEAISLSRFTTYFYYMYHANDPIIFSVYAYKGSGIPTGEWTADWVEIGTVDARDGYAELSKVASKGYSERLANGESFSVAKSNSFPAQYYRFKMKANGYRVFGMLDKTGVDYANGNCWQRGGWMSIAEISIYKYI